MTSKTLSTGLYARQSQNNTSGGGWTTVRPPPPTAVPVPQRPAPYGALIVAAGFIIAAIILVAYNRPQAPRAQLVVWPRAEAIGPYQHFDEPWYANPVNRGGWFAQIIPCQGAAVWIHYRGQIGSYGMPPSHPQLWDEYHIPDGANWVWMIPLGASTPGWVDP